ncbi:MAG TPA: iron ABC transporter substrate-binding protein [Methanospirillum sp.]|nr:iron ABC transporter substrate-binding protein [Methanospirillum sp.]
MRIGSLWAISFASMYCILLFFAIAAMPAMATESSGSIMEITDLYDRTVTVPVHPDKIIGSNAGALRFICFLGVQDKVVAVDAYDNQVPTKYYGKSYLLANPHFADLPIFGEGMGKDDPEKIVKIGPQVIFKTSPSAAKDLDELQTKTGIPVVGLKMGGLNTEQNKKDFYDSLKVIAKVMGKEARADEIISYVDGQIAELEKRTVDVDAAKAPTTYIGGVAFRGPHGIESTEPAYPPFKMIHANNIAESMGTDHADIAKEKIVDQDPSVIFVDLGTLQMNGTTGLDELKTDPSYQTLSAVKSGEVYGVLPYNWYSWNPDNMLADAWYIGSVLYPDKFSGLNMKEKANEIYNFFVQKPLYDEMNSQYDNLAFTRLTL